MNKSKLIFVLSTIIWLSSCAIFSPLKQLNNAYVTQVFHSELFLLNRFNTFEVYHNGGQKINSCLKKIDEFKKNKINTVVFAPCVYENELSKIWLNKSTLEYSLKHYFEIDVVNIPIFFNEVGINESKEYNLQIILTPKNNSYYYNKSFLQSNELALLVGMPIDLENPNYNDIINSLINNTVHEYTHVHDIYNGVVAADFKHEYTATLSSYCALVTFGNYNTKRPPLAYIELNIPYLKYVTIKKISDQMISKTISLEKILNGKSIKIKALPVVIAMIILEKNLYNLIDNYDDSDLNSNDKKKIIEYCNTELKNHFKEL